MRDRPNGEELLACARRVLKEEVLPTVPAGQRHNVLMAMNAMSIAERQLQKGEAALREEHALLKRLLGREGAPLELRRTLCQELRGGLGDPGSSARPVLWVYLKTLTRLRLEESNPKALPASKS